MPDPYLIIDADFRLQVAVLRHLEKTRVSVQNRLFSLTSFPRRKDWGLHLPDDHPDVMFIQEILGLIESREDETVGSLSARYRKTQLNDWSSQYKGLGPGKLMARLLGEIGDPYVFPDGGRRKFSQLRSLAGVSVVDGHAPRHAAGQQSGFRPQARTRLWLVSDQLIKQHAAPYHQVFLEGVEKYKDEKYRGVGADKKPWSDERFAVIGRKRARLLVSTRFLRDLYRAARDIHLEAEGESEAREASAEEAVLREAQRTLNEAERV